MNPSSTKADVFIIESLDIDDEDHHRFEGQVISDVLRMAGKRPKYYYCNSIEEFEKAIDLFYVSRYRYLHISSHANEKEIIIGDTHIAYKKFSRILSGKLDERRLFLSSCETGNKNLSIDIIKNNPNAYSITAPAEEILFSEAAAIWPSLYVSLFKINNKSMRSADILNSLKPLTELFNIKFFSSRRSVNTGRWSHKTIHPHI